MSHDSERIWLPTDAWGGDAAAGRPFTSAVHRDEHLLVRLTYYPPGFAQPPHRHEQSVVSVLLAGSLKEHCDGTTVTAVGPALSTKPAGLRHQNKFGPGGALIASVTPLAGALEAMLARSQWTWRRSSGFAALARTMLSPGGAADAAFELLGASGEEPGRGLPARSAPRWVREARDAILAEPDLRLGSLAMRLGVHRVTLARAFLRYFGVTPSRYRAEVACARALGHVLGHGGSIASAAQHAHFADQSHLARAARRSAGMTVSNIVRHLRR